MKILYVMLALLSTLLGVVGIVLPLLPTTPFLLLALYFFSKGSERFERIFLKSKLYENHLKEFHLNRELSRKNKVRLLLFSDAMIIMAMVMSKNHLVISGLLVLEVFKYWYFLKRIKTRA